MAGLSLDINDDWTEALAQRVAALVLERIEFAEAAPVGWMDTRAAAEYAGCSVNALHKAMAAREVQFSQERSGGKAWFRAAWIDAWREGEDG